MSSGIGMSLGARRSLAAYQSISTQIEAVQERLATGRKVNGAFDKPAAFFTSATLNSRAASINSLMDGMSKATSALEAASNGVGVVRSLLASAQSLANSAMLSANTLVKVTGASTPVLTTATVIASTSGSSSRLRAGDTITVSDGTVTATYTAVNNDTVQTVLDAVNNHATLKVDASLNASGQIVLQAQGTNNITIGGTFGGTGTLLGVTGLSAGTTTFVANAARTSYSAQFDAIRTQINTAAADAGFDGLNLLAGGSQSFAFNETGTSSINLTGTTLTAAGLGMAASTNQFQIDSDLTTALANITSALTSLEAQTATLSSNLAIIEARSEFNQNMIDTLMSGADDLVLADTNADGAILLALQARQKLASTTLSISGESDRLALRLFGLS